MATTNPKKLFGGTLTTSAGATRYTVPASTTTVITSIVVCNKTSSAATITLGIDGTSAFAAASVNANETWFLGPEDIRQVLSAGATITGSAGTSSAIDLRISGAEIA